MLLNLCNSSFNLPSRVGCVIRAFLGGLNAHITYFGLQMKNKKAKQFLTNLNLPRSILVDFRRFSDFSALVLHCAYIFKARKTLDTAIWSLDIVFYGIHGILWYFMKDYFYISFEKGESCGGISQDLNKQYCRKRGSGEGIKSLAGIVRWVSCRIKKSWLQK